MPLVSDLLALENLPALEVTSLAHDSRLVQARSLFFAIPGTAVDGTTFAAGAVKDGAVAVAAERDLALDVPTILVPNVRAALAEAAGKFYAEQPQHIAAITGTNGKTSIADFCRQLWQMDGQKAASIGTLGWNGDTAFLGEKFEAKNTSPDPLLLQQGLNQLAQHEVQHVALEASSHGLHQHRLDGAKITSAAFTNLSHDHLDYHPNMQAYFEAKMRLFTELLPQDGTAILHADDSYSSAAIELCRARGQRIWTVGTHGEELKILSLHPVAEGIRTELSLWGDAHTITLPLYGAFQVSNALCALGLVVAEGADADTAIANLEKLQGVPGRLQNVAQHKGALVFIDYAHTPDALHTILLTLRPHCEGKLHVVFGCGGDRDKTKRPEMGAIAAQHADRVIITDDNPRSEDAATIRKEILTACEGATEIGDRAEAIATATQALEPGDILVVAGKGHEDYQIIGTQTLHFNDAEEIRKVAQS